MTDRVTYRDPAPPVEIPSPQRRDGGGAILVVLAALAGFVTGYALAVLL